MYSFKRSFWIVPLMAVDGTDYAAEPVVTAYGVGIAAPR